MKYFWFLIPATAILTSPTSAMYRQWNDLDGKFSIEAEYIAYKDGKIYLEKEDGAALSFPVDRLSRADREYLRKLSVSEEAELFKYLDKHPLKDERAVFITADLFKGCTFLDFSPDGRLLAMGTLWGLHVVDLKTSQFVARMTNFEPNNAVYLCRFSPDGKKLITSHPLNIVRVWKIDDKTSLTLDKEYKQHRFSFLSALAFSPDGKRALTTDVEGIRYWDLETATDVVSLNNLQSVKAAACIINSDGTHALVAGGRKLVEYDLDTTRVTKWMTLSKGRFPIPAISPDGKLVAVADFDGIHLWKTFESKKLATLEEYLWATEMAFSPNGKYLLTACADDLRLWSVADQKLVQSYPYIAKQKSNAIAFSPDSQFFAASTGAGNETVQVFRIESPSN